MVNFDLLRDHLDKWHAQEVHNPLFLAAITSARYAFEK
jgi:hypothetical protein